MFEQSPTGNKMREEAQKILTSIEKINNYENLLDLFKNEYFYVQNTHNGTDHSEHILKRITYYSLTRDEELIKTFPDGLAQKVRELAPQNQGDVMMSWPEILKNEYPNKFSDEQINRIESKLSLDVFSSIDSKMENIVLALNSLDGVETIYSCSGHKDDLYKPNSFSTNLSFSSNNGNFVSYIKEKIHAQMLLGVYITKNNVSINSPEFSFVEWADENSKVKVFKKLLDYINDESRKDYNFDELREYLYKVGEEKNKKLLHPDYIVGSIANKIRLISFGYRHKDLGGTAAICGDLNEIAKDFTTEEYINDILEFSSLNFAESKRDETLELIESAISEYGSSSLQM